MKINIPQKAEHIISLLEAAGYKAYIVGGCVRDALLGIEPHDWDICTNALPQQTKAALEAAGVHTFDTGIKHGTVSALVEDELFEVTTFRSEGKYSDGRHPDNVEFIDSIEGDLCRRDFTVNAMAYNSQAGLVDICGGQADLQNNLLRCVGNAHERFAEDALRILRALRFAAIYGFEIDEECKCAIHEDKELLDNIARERIRDELLRLICGDNAQDILLEYSDVFGQIIPQLKPMFGFDQHNKYHKYDVWEHCVRALGYSVPDQYIRFTLLVHDIGKPHVFFMDDEGCGHFYGHPQAGEPIAREVCKSLKMPNAITDEICELVLHHDRVISLSARAMRRLILKLGVFRMHQLMEVRACDALAHSDLKLKENLIHHNKVCELFEQTLASMNAFSLRDLNVSGKDIIALGIDAGPEVGKILKKLLAAVTDEKVPNEHCALLSYAKKLIS